MSQHIDQSDTFCFDCVYMYHYTVPSCLHTICNTCFQIRLQQETFICPRCIGPEEHQQRLGKVSIPEPTKVQQKYDQFEFDSNFKQGMITKLNKFAKSSDTNAPLQSEALMKQRRRTIVWHPQHVAYYRSYHDSKSSSNCQSTRFSLSLSSLFELDPFEASWPNGTEPWHIHEIRPQRQSFASKIDLEPSIITQAISVECKNQAVEPILQLDRNPLESESKVGQISILSAQLTPNLHDVVAIDACLQKSLRLSETNIVWNVLKLQLYQCKLKLYNLSNGLLRSSHILSHLQSKPRPRSSSSQLINVLFILFLLFFVTMLTRFGIVHNSPHLFGGVVAQSPIFEFFFIIGIIHDICSNYLKHSKPYVKTIETLRKLESLLIYPTT